VDGATHSSDEEQEYDRRRDAYLRSRGWRVIRVTNIDIYRRLDDVLDGFFRLPQGTVSPPAAPIGRLRRPLPP
jgi:very-short-patch-repair endonuclease